MLLDFTLFMFSEKLSKLVLDRNTRTETPVIRDINSRIEDFPIVREGSKFKCQKCGLLLLKKNYLISHMRYVHKICMKTPMSLFICHLCNKQFIRKARLNEHMVHFHSGESIYTVMHVTCSEAQRTSAIYSNANRTIAI